MAKKKPALALVEAPAEPPEPNGHAEIEQAVEATIAPAPPAEPMPLTSFERMAIEGLQARSQLLNVRYQQEMERLQADDAELMQQIAVGHGLDPQRFRETHMLDTQSWRILPQPQVRDA